MFETRQDPKSIWSYNPIPGGCVLYLPLWHPSLSGGVFKSIDPFGHTCTVTGATYGVTGRTFDGATHIITIPGHAALSALSTITAMCWFNQDIQGTEGLVSKDAAGNAREFALQLHGTGGFLGYYQFSATATNYLYARGDVDISDTNWHCGAATWNGVNAISNIKIYTDGTLNGYDIDGNEKVLTGAVAHDSATDVEIGRYAATDSVCLDGKIGEAWIYNRVLSAREILYIYNKTKFRY